MFGTHLNPWALIISHASHNFSYEAHLALRSACNLALMAEHVGVVNPETFWRKFDLLTPMRLGGTTSKKFTLAEKLSSALFIILNQFKHNAHTPVVHESAEPSAQAPRYSTHRAYCKTNTYGEYKRNAFTGSILGSVEDKKKLSLRIHS